MGSSSTLATVYKVTNPTVVKSEAFTEDDFVWDGHIEPYKDTIVTGVNYLHRENSKCKEIDPRTVSLLLAKSRPGRPVFVVMCGSGKNAVQVGFAAAKSSVPTLAAAGVFTEEDILWDKYTEPYKDIVVAGVNKLHRENSRCKEIDPGMAMFSPSKSSPGNPVFFVLCGSGAKAHNVFFSKSDVASEKTLVAAKHIGRETAISLCEKYARNSATHPSTVDFSRVINLGVHEHPNGRTTVISTFTAKNGFNLKIKFGIRCLLNANGFIEATVNEAS